MSNMCPRSRSRVLDYPCEQEHPKSPQELPRGGMAPKRSPKAILSVWSVLSLERSAAAHHPSHPPYPPIPVMFIFSFPISLLFCATLQEPPAGGWLSLASTGWRKGGARMGVVGRGGSFVAKVVTVIRHTSPRHNP